MKKDKTVKVTVTFTKTITQYDLDDAQDGGYHTVEAWLLSLLNHPDDLYFVFGKDMALSMETSES